MIFETDINFEFDQYKEIINSEIIQKWIEDLYRELAIQEQFCALYFAGIDTVKALNHQYLNKNYPTDVLSFSQLEGEEIKANHFLGDIVICVPFARDQAAEHGHSLMSELKYLILHGLLHLLGYDHDQAENGEMSRIEHEIYYALTGEIIE